jgi:hypothetical protein
MAANGRSVVTLLLALVSTSCDSPVSERVLTVEEVIPRIDELDGQAVSVAGYLSECAGYNCILYRTKADSDEMARFMATVHANPPLPFPDDPMLGIGSGTNFDFDAKAAPFTNSYVVISGRITNDCRFKGKPRLHG